jgi:hypothetical protein
MYWLLQGSESEATSDPFEKQMDNIFTFAAKIDAAFIKAFDVNRINNFFLTIESDAVKLNTQIGNGLTDNLKNIENTIFDVYKEGLKYGFAYGDAKEFISTIADGLGRTTFYQKENVTQSLALAKAMGITGKEVATMVKDLMVMGIGPEKANQILTNTFIKARTYGVDASKLTATVSKNILQAQAYGFKGGVDGLTKMAIQAQRLGIDLEKAMSAADDLLDPEKAIEAASSMQMLGGAVGALADPFQLMHLAQSDVGELQNQIGQTTAKMVKFNSATGDFKIDPAMRRDMTQLAQSLGMDYKTVADMAIKFRKEQEVASKIPLFSTMNEADKSLIASMAEIKNGEVMIKIPGSDNMIKASELNASKIDELRKKQEKVEEEKDPLVIAGKQLTAQEKMAITLEEMKNSVIFRTGYQERQKVVKETEDVTMYGNLKTSYEKVQKEFDDNMTTIQTTLTAGYESASTLIQKTVDGFTNRFTEMVNNMTKIVNKTINFTSETGDDVYIPAGTNKTISTGFGNLINLNKGDASLNIPQEDMDNLLNYANFGDKMSKMVPNTKIPESKVGTLTNYIEQKIVTETTSKQEVNVGGSADINIKIDSNIPQNMLDKIIDNPELKRTIMSQINERLSKSFKEKLINPLT